MRKIEKMMVDSIRSFKDREEWYIGESVRWSEGNTVVIGMMDHIEVYLHGHKIAHYDVSHNEWSISLAGWNTATTRSRLSAIVSTFGNARGVSSKGGEARLVYPDRERPIPSHGWVMV